MKWPEPPRPARGKDGGWRGRVTCRGDCKAGGQGGQPELELLLAGDLWELIEDAGEKWNLGWRQFGNFPPPTRRVRRLLLPVCARYFPGHKTCGIGEDGVNRVDALRRGHPGPGQRSEEGLEPVEEAGPDHRPGEEDHR